MILMYSHLRTILIHYRGSGPAFYPSQLAIRGELNTTHPRPSAERHVWVLDAESFRVNLLQYKVKVSAISARGQRAEMVVRCAGLVRYGKKVLPLNAGNSGKVAGRPRPYKVQAMHHTEMLDGWCPSSYLPSSQLWAGFFRLFCKTRCNCPRYTSPRRKSGGWWGPAAEINTARSPQGPGYCAMSGVCVVVWW